MKTYTVENSDASRDCGHKHKSVEAASACGRKLHDSHFVGNNGQRVRSGGTWQACAAWHGWRIVDNDTGERMQPTAE